MSVSATQGHAVSIVGHSHVSITMSSWTSLEVLHVLNKPNPPEPSTRHTRYIFSKSRMSSSWFATIQSHAWLCGGVVLLLTTLIKCVYRLTLHPLSNFPGPRLAAVTSLYGAFYDLRPSTSYVKLFPSMHQKYGELHGSLFAMHLTACRTSRACMAEPSANRRH